MSGYFARLVAQLNGPSAPTGRGAAQGPSSLEQHVEVEVSPGVSLKAAMEGVASSHHQQRSPDMAKETPPLREPSAAKAVDAGQAVAMPGQDMPVRETRSMSPRRSDAIASTSMAFTPTNCEPMPVGPLVHRVASAAMAVSAVNPGIQTTAASHLAVQLAKALPSQAVSNAEERVRSAQPFAAFTAPMTRARAVDGVLQAPSRPSTGPANQVAATSRNDIRIGTITLEVRPPATPAPAAPPPLTAPVPAPQQVALRRHYLRWS